MDTKVLDKKILLIEFPGSDNVKEINLTFFRLDSWENPFPELRGRFTPDMFLDKFSDENGNFDTRYSYDDVPYGYFSYWDGYNISKKNLDAFPFIRKSDRETRIIKLAAMNKIPKNGYIIAVMKDGLITTRKHEHAHAFAYVYPEYKTQVQAVVNSIPQPIKDKFWAGLQKDDYTFEVLDDEIQAYLVGYDAHEFSNYFPDLTEDISVYVAQIKAIFDPYYNKFNI